MPKKNKPEERCPRHTVCHDKDCYARKMHGKLPCTCNPKPEVSSPQTGKEECPDPQCGKQNWFCPAHIEQRGVCAECGSWEDIKISKAEQIKYNAVGGRCFKCVNKNTNTCSAPTEDCPKCFPPDKRGEELEWKGKMYPTEMIVNFRKLLDRLSSQGMNVRNEDADFILELIQKNLIQDRERVVEAISKMECCCGGVAEQDESCIKCRIINLITSKKL